ncbi:MAG: VWA domain-containing protein [Paracoccaceae bacterium]
MLTLAYPWVLIILPLPYLAWRYLPPYQEKSHAVRVPFFRSIAEAIGSEPKPGAIIRNRKRIQMMGAILCWGLVVLGLSQPQRLGEPITIEKAARDLVLAIDISGSMDDRDMRDPDGKPLQRLEAVKQVVSAFIEERDGDRIALIVFGSNAYLQIPFTEDLETAAELMMQTEVGMAGPHTALGDAIGLALRTFQTSEVEQKLLVLLSDGADTNSRMSPVNAAEIAAKEGVAIYTIGVGDENASGEGRVDLGALKDIAARANGGFYFANDPEGLRVIYEKIDELNPRLVETIKFQPKESLAHILFASALVSTLTLLFWLCFIGRWGFAHDG